MATFFVVLKCNAALLLVKLEEWAGFSRDYEIALDIMSRYMPPEPGTAAIFAGGGVPKDFIQITATTVAAQRVRIRKDRRSAARNYRDFRTGLVLRLRHLFRQF
jgi:hypothetical protein